MKQLWFMTTAEETYVELNSKLKVDWLGAKPNSNLLCCKDQEEGHRCPKLTENMKFSRSLLREREN